ncbi:MAG: hypothetical protein WCF43_11495 [Steroidobacteraceae bacterium]
MIRSAGKALVGAAVLAASAGCVSEDSFGLPDLTPGGASSGAQVYPGYGHVYGYGYGTGYPGVYQPGYGYGYVDPRYAAQGPYPYGYGYAYNPYPRYIVVPCADSNRDGRCDVRPPHQHQDQDQHDDDGDDLPARPRPGYRGEVPRVRDGGGRGVAPTAQQRAVPAPAPVPQQPVQVRPEPRRTTPSEAASQRGPRAGSGRPSMGGDDSSRPTQEP